MNPRSRSLSVAVAAGMSFSGLIAAWAESTPANRATPAPAAAVTAGAKVAPAAPAAPAAESADALLQRVDKMNTSFQDAIFHFKMLIKEPSGQVREVEFLTKQKGQKRLVRFLAPADVKGMGILVESAEVMYAMLPAFGNRIRRLGTHQLNQSFMGSDLSNDDMSTVAFGPLYSAKSAGSEGTATIVELNLKAGKQAEFPRLKMWIDPQNATITKIEYMDNSGKKLRTQTRSEFKKDSIDHLSPGKLTFIDHRKNNHQTDLLLLESKLNTNLGDDEFTQRALQRD